MTVKTNDVQCTVTGRLKQGSQGELICFTVRLGFFELACIANIPAEGEETAPVYIKWKIRKPEDKDSTTSQGAQSRKDREDVREEG